MGMADGHRKAYMMRFAQQGKRLAGWADFDSGSIGLSYWQWTVCYLCAVASIHGSFPAAIDFIVEAVSACTCALLVIRYTLASFAALVSRAQARGE